MRRHAQPGRPLSPVPVPPRPPGTPGLPMTPGLSVPPRRRAPLLLLGALLLSALPGASGPLTAQSASARSAPSQPPLRPLSLEDYYRVKSVGSVEISPDGRWVGYTVSLPVEDTNGDVVESWVVRSDGSAPPERVLHGGMDVTDPGWEADGRLRYTLRDTVWTRDPARSGDAPQRLVEAGPEGTPSPDGRWVVRTERVAPTPRPEPPLTDFQRRHRERFQGDDFDWYPFRQDGQPFPLPDPAERGASELFLEPVDGSAPPRQLTRLGLQPGNLRWLPDGGTILFTANEGVLDEIAYGSTDLFKVTVDGELTRLTEDGYDYSGVEISPDGRWISYVRSFSTEMIIQLRLDHGGPRDLYLQPVDGGEPVNLTGGWDRDPQNVRWSPDGRHLYFTAQQGGEVHLFRVAAPGEGANAVATAPVQQITTGPRRINGITFDRSFRRMAYTVGDFDRPAEVWTADVDGGNERRLTDTHGAFLAEVALATRPSESVTWTSYDGTEIEGFLLYPHGYDPASPARHPLIIMNHGGPHAASGYGFSFKNSLFAAHGYFVLLPNFRSSTGYGDDFKWATWGGWGIKDGEDVMAGVDHLVARLPIDRERVGTTGHSYGGILSNWLITRYPERFRAAVPGAGESNWTSNFALSDVSRTKETEFFGAPWDPRAREIMIAQSPALNCGGVQAATLFVHGEVDYRVPLEGSIQLYTCLKKQRVPTRLIIYEGQAHGIRGHWNQVHRMMSELGWWEMYLKGGTGVSDGD
jgi:dipeptidyl aminopeptidase/acylaminoacyl peptidase